MSREGLKAEEGPGLSAPALEALGLPNRLMDWRDGYDLDHGCLASHAAFADRLARREARSWQSGLDSFLPVAQRQAQRGDHVGVAV